MLVISDFLIGVAMSLFCHLIGEWKLTVFGFVIFIFE